GASDLGGALAMATTSGMTRVIVVGDGTPTIGEYEPEKLARIVKNSPIERVDAIRVGTSIDRTTLQAVVGAGKAAGAIFDGRDVDAVARGLAVAVPAEMSIHVAGTTGV